MIQTVLLAQHLMPPVCMTKEQTLVSSPYWDFTKSPLEADHKKCLDLLKKKIMKPSTNLQ